MQLASPSLPEEAGRPASTPIFRPLQYLGAKLRSLDALRAVVSEHPPGRAVDLFTGSSVVAQALAAEGQRVEAYDALHLCAVGARATLGVGRSQEDPVAIGRWLLERAHLPEQAAFDLWIRAERRAIEAGDGEGLLRLGAQLPQVWRPQGAEPALEALLNRMDRGAGQPAAQVGPVAATHYAGTYLGIGQALAVDGLRRAIATHARTLGPWGTDAALTALLAALSAAVFTPGKHFAQPHRIRGGKALDFHRRRALADRSRCIREDFLAALASLAALPTRGSHGHQAERRTLESWRGVARQVDLVYADPPYTAQQYARFYHLPEVLLIDRVPRLARHRGAITRGLYPEGRHRSRFCRRTEAAAAFDELIGRAASWGARLLLSYATSRSGRTGNDRMIQLDALLAACRTHYRQVRLIELPVAYRQLNRAGAAVEGRADLEVLICASGPC